MRILHILDHSLPRHSGYTFRTLAILQHQRVRGWETLQLTSAKQGECAVEQAYDGWIFLRTPPLQRWWARLPMFKQLAIIVGLRRRLQEIASNARPQILHAHSPALNGVAALRVGRLLDIPVVYEVRAYWEDAATDHGSSRLGGPRYRLTRALETYVLRRVDAVTTICEGLRADLIARGVPATKITVIPNAVAPIMLAPGIKPAALATGLDLRGQCILGFIGSFYAYEGLSLLIAVLPSLLAALPTLPVQLLLVGGGPQEAALRAQVAQLGLDTVVRFTGRVAHQHIAAYYELADILVYPRLPMRLTELVTPLKPLEAMAQGRLVLASDVGGHRELIEHGKTGVLFQAGDAHALTQALLQLISNSHLWPSMRQQALAYVRSSRNWPDSVARYAPIYQRLSRGRT